MFCEKHKCPMHEVCGEERCGLCFAEEMERKTMKAPKREPGRRVFVHKKVVLVL